MFIVNRLASVYFYRAGCARRIKLSGITRKGYAVVVRG